MNLLIVNWKKFFDEIDILSLEFRLEEALENDKLAQKFYNLLSSKFCEKFNFSPKDFDKHYDSLY